MSDLAALLQASLAPATRKQSEHTLNDLTPQSGFLPALLALCLDQNHDRAVRLAASVYLKNVARTRWDEEVAPLPEPDKASLRAQLVPAMLALSSPAEKILRTQIAESISLVAEVDFPERWPDLMTQLVASLSATDYNVNVGVLHTAHSIFRPWRAQSRGDRLFTVINLVLTVFAAPFLDLFRATAQRLLDAPQSPPDVALLAQAQVLMTEIYYDLTCQDLPPQMEDTHEAFFATPDGLFQRFMNWDPAELRGDPDDTTPSLPSQLKTSILELAELFIKLYPEQLTKSRAVEGFVQSVWALVGAGKLPGLADDGFVSQALRFISTAIRIGYYKELFGAKETIDSLVQGVVVPNVGLREHDMEQFEDDPLEFIRLSLAQGDTTTRRQAAADVLQALVASGHAEHATAIVGEWIQQGLAAYAADPSGQWKAKDGAVYLLTAVATRGSTMLHGVTATNALVDVVKFFSDNVFQDLQAPEGTVAPILQVDAIRFLHTFRNQLTKEQLLSVLPLLVRHLGSENYVTYTYAAITIDRILFIKQGNQLMFNQTDIQAIAPELLNVLLTKIESAGTAEKVAENDHLMKCAMRVILTGRQTFTPGFERTLGRLVAILGVISKNPSNPNFDQYIFESLSALMRFVVGASPAALPTFEQALFGPFTVILQQEIDQYIPYVFQVLAQMLQLHTAAEIPADYRGLLPFLLNPAIWAQKGSIPGLVKLLTAFLSKDAKQMMAAGQIAAVLGVVQQRLIPSKVNDVYGFELLQAVVQHVTPADLKQYFRVVIVQLLSRLQTGRTDRYIYSFTYFTLFTMAIDANGLTPDYLVGTVEEIQPQLWSQLLTNFIIPQIPKISNKDRRVAAVGLTRMLTQCTVMLQGPTVQAWPAAFTALVRLFSEPQYLKDARKTDPDAEIADVDPDELNGGYQAAYSRLAASESTGADPVASVRDPQAYLGQELARNSSRVKGLIANADPQVVGPFLQGLAAAGIAL